jgi:hypothetical protein
VWMWEFAVSDWPDVQPDIFRFVGGMIACFVGDLSYTERAY